VLAQPVADRGHVHGAAVGAELGDGLIDPAVTLQRKVLRSEPGGLNLEVSLGVQHDAAQHRLLDPVVQNVRH